MILVIVHRTVNTGGWYKLLQFWVWLLVTETVQREVVEVLVILVLKRLKLNFYSILENKYSKFYYFSKKTKNGSFWSENGRTEMISKNRRFPAKIYAIYSVSFAQFIDNLHFFSLGLVVLLCEHRKPAPTNTMNHSVWFLFVAPKYFLNFVQRFRVLPIFL